MNYKPQIQRIKKKLKIAQKTDKHLEVFGAKSHKYLIKEPIQNQHIDTFEKDYHVSLPDCYIAFLTEIGNGGCSYQNSAAGPFYGIYPFGENVDEFTEYPKDHLRQSVVIFPTMTEAYWAKSCRPIETDENLSDIEFGQKMDNFYAGILPIGSQGCTYAHGLLLNGPHKGKVVNLDLSRQKPRFTYEKNFLDWYERWLDEIISGDLLIENPAWFGYAMGGTDQELISKYKNVSDVSYKYECLNGFLYKAKLSPETVDIIEREYLNPDNRLSLMALQILTKTDYTRAKPFLRQTFRKSSLQVLQYVFWYAKKFSEDWIPEITQILSAKNIDDKLFRFATYLTAECRTDLSGLVKPFIRHNDKKIRDQATYILEKMKARI